MYMCSTKAIQQYRQKTAKWNALSTSKLQTLLAKENDKLQNLLHSDTPTHPAKKWVTPKRRYENNIALLESILREKRK